jgi:hypothetical protein
MSEHGNNGHGPSRHAHVVTRARRYLTCELCAAHRAVDPEQLDAVREQIAASFGDHASFTRFPIVGLCPNCATALSVQR